MTKKVFLCIGNKKQPKCVFSDVEYLKIERPIYASSEQTQIVESLSVYCRKKYRVIGKAVYKCGYFMNSTLPEG